MIKVYEILVGIFLFYSYMIFIKNLSQNEFRYKKGLIVYIICYTVIYALTVYGLEPGISTFISVICIIAGYKIFLKISYKDLLFYSIIQWSIAFIFDIVTMNLFNSLVKPSIIGQDVYRIIGSFIIAIIFCFLGKSKTIIKFVNKIKKYLYSTDYYLYLLICTIVIYYYLGYFCIKNINEISIPIIILIIAVSLFIYIITFIIQQSQIKSLKDNIVLLSKNNEFYIERIDEYRVMKHNLIANLNSIRSSANKKTKQLIDDLIIKYKSMLKMPKNIKQLPSGVNGIIYEKIYNIKDKNLNISIDNKIKNNVIEILSARDYNMFCEAISVTLDNAIEAAEQSEEKILYLEFTEDDNKLMLKIINSFSGMIDIDELGKKNYTSKKTGNGLGLFSILKYKPIKLNSSIKDNKFICVIRVNKKY